MADDGGGRVSEFEGNPLLDAWREVFGQDAVYSWHKRWDQGRVIDGYRQRHNLCATYSFAIPDDDALALIASFGPIIEIGAGTGYWARLLRERGCDVLAYDVFGADFKRWFPAGQYGGVKRGGVAKVAKHPDRTLLMVWPFMDSMAADALRTYEAAGGQRVIYVGEGMGGCCANDEFFTMVGESCRHPDDEPCEHPPATWREVNSIAIPQWEGINDYLTVYERREG